MTYSTQSASPDGSGWTGNQGNEHRGRRCGFARWRPLELLAMILGFIVFWPIGLAVIGFKIWQRRAGYEGDMFSFAEDRVQAMRSACHGWRNSTPAAHTARGFGGFGGGWSPRPTGNSAFDDWRAGELARLEEERRKLEAAEREFSEHIEQLRRARDREEFERFMNARNAQPPHAS